MTELSGYVFSALRRGEFTLYRGTGDGLDSILLVEPIGEHPARESLKRLEHEHELKAELGADWAVRPVDLSRHNGRMALLLEDPGGEPLDQLLGQPMDVTQFLRIAIPLAAAVGQVHERGLIHKDLKPANILVDVASGGVWLTGFGIASRLPRERQASAPPEIIAGTLAYMAPEQTGRMNRSIDARSDLYSLGVTFYEMLTGTLPFTAADPMEWVHCHIARQPAPPDERVAGIPGPLSVIVMKLLAKTAEERYQTAAGVESDLRRCLTAWESHGRIDPFPLGAYDVSDRLLIPEKLYGREREIETLLAAFDRVVTSGRPELVLVSGYSGIGKSAVVNELHKALVSPHGLFASGKFDQYKRDIPYATLAQAFQSLVRQLLSTDDAKLNRWRNALLEALGANGQLMINLIPELALIIGEQPPVSELPPQDAQNRFQLVFRRFLGVIARPEHPLALFLDDLQWLDAATLDVLADLLTQPDVQWLLVIGAYRDNEVDSTHPLMRKLDAVRKAGAFVQEIRLAPLAREDLGRLIADTLSCAPRRAAPLAQLVHEKTGGNPFFAIQFISALAEEGLLQFDHDVARWRWELDCIHAKGYTDNVVDLMVGKVTRLPVKTQAALQQLACLGNSAEVTTLSLVHETSEEQVHGALWEVVRLELIDRLDGSYRFVHDRVREAAYSLIPEGLRAAAHLRIGRILASSDAPEEIEERIFEIANHLNRGAELIASLAERDRLAELNLRAGKRAKSSTAYQSALAYLRVGRALLSRDCWDRQYPLAFSFELHLAECEFLTGDAAAEERLSKLSERARSLVDVAAVASLRQVLYTMLDRLDRSVEVGLDYLRKVGVDWTAQPTKEEVVREYEEMFARLESRSIEEMAELPRMSDPNCCATVEVLTELVPAAYFTDIDLCSLVVCRIANLSFEHGNSNGSVYAYSLLGFLLRTRFGNHAAGFRFGMLALKLADERGLDRFRARVSLNFAYCVNPWTRHIQTGRALLRRGLTAANETGDLTFAAYLYYCLITDLLASGDPLDQAQREAESGLEFASRTKFGLVVDILTGHLRLIRALRGLTVELGSFSDAAFDEHRFEEHLEGDPRLANPTCVYWIRKLQARYFAGDYAAAVAAAAKAEPLLWTSPASFEMADYHFYAGLTRAAHHDTAPVGERASDLKALAANHRQIAAWAKNCPDNFENRDRLLAAEIARIDGRELDAERLYEQAIRSARANGFVHNEALAYEVAARFYAARGFETNFHAHLRNARQCYLRWGADGKVRQLDTLYPHLLEDEPVPSPTRTIGAPIEHLDLATVIKVSQAISGEVVLEKLIDTALRTAIEQAGAERGLLILSRGGEPRITAEATTRGATVVVQVRDELATATTLPESVLRYVLRTRECVILDDALAETPFATDPYIRQCEARSILCLPLINQTKLIGVLYLENNLAPRVFAPARTAVLKLLASQAAIALENTGLYHDLAKREAKIRRLVDANIVGVLISEPDGQVLEANAAFLDMLGYSRDELASGQLRWTELTPPEWQAVSRQAVDQIRATGSCDLFEKEYFRKDGNRVPVLVAAAGIGTPPSQAVAFVLDMSERKRAEEELRRSKAYLAEAQRLSRTGSFGWSVATGEIIWSDETFRIFGYDKAPSVTIDMVVQRTHPDDRGAVQQTIDRAARDVKDFSHECRLLMPDGAVKHVHAVAHAVKDASGNIEFFGAVTDVTATKQAEDALRQSQMQLAHVTRVTTLGELAASIAHEVNQPLAAIVTYGEAGLRWLDREVPDLAEVREALGDMINNGRRAGEIVQRLRALSKRTETQTVALDINELIKDVMPLVQGQVLSHRVSLRLELAPALPAVLGDRVQLQQVIINLIVNGMEAMASVTDRPRELVVRSQLDDSGQILVAVEDSGIGIDPDNAKQLFNAFFTTKSSGMGMGLSICRSIIEAHGGKLWPSRNAGPGATFQFTLRSHQQVGS